MAATAGRKVRIKVGGTSVAGARTDTVTINNTPIDITDKDDAGVRTLLNDVGTKSVDMSVEGVLIDDTLLELCLESTSGTALATASAQIAGIGTVAGTFFLGNFEFSGAEGDEPTTFTGNLQSAGAFTWTATA